MNTLRAMRALRELARDDRGTTSIEYAILAAGIAGVLIAVVASIGTSLNTMYTSVSNGFN
jgi:pilus assembly protein Flp/PilA